jgi:predicted DNA-binding transcriptional regulator YafY
MLVTSRRGEPYGFLLGHRHYLVANDLRQGEVRNFALGGISDLEILEEVFERPASFDMRTYTKHYSCGFFHLEAANAIQPNGGRSKLATY